MRYVTADLAQPGVDLVLDVTALDLPDASFDAILCSHVLEHVDDDRSAMAVLRRITAPGGWCAVMVPIDLGRETTYEDPSITSPEDRRRAFWQHDHVRLYAADIGDRLAAAGFDVERVRPEHEFGVETLARCRILAADDIWLCRATVMKVCRIAANFHHRPCRPVPGPGRRRPGEAPHYGAPALVRHRAPQLAPSAAASAIADPAARPKVRPAANESPHP